MAEQKGTGQHAHKSSEEPYPHHEAPTTRGESGESESHSESRGGSRASQGRGEASGTQSGSEEQSSSRSSSRSSNEKESGSQNSSKDSDLKSREYRDNEGNIHHHTRTAEAMKEGGSGSRGKEDKEE